MNHLAHTFLSYPDEDCLIGNFLTDFLTLNELKSLEPRFLKGVDLHREIDAYTDSHPAVKECVTLLRPLQKKYTPVVIDIYFDYFLIKNWDLFHVMTLNSYIEQVYAVIEANKKFMPTKMHDRIVRMVVSDFLRSCSNSARLKTTFQFLQQRTRFDNLLHRAHEDLLYHESALNSLFLIFFPDLVTFVKSEPL